MDYEIENGECVIALRGRIDADNAAKTEEEIQAILTGCADSGRAAGKVILDVAEVDYISSAGLRAMLRLKKRFPVTDVVNASPEVYEILDMTGFTDLFRVEKAYRRISVDGCEVIGEGYNGKVYRYGGDIVVKTYKNADALAEIKHEREVARLALILGVPTAISYDVVRVGDSYGSVFELLNARSFSKILAEEPEKMDFCVKEYVDVLKKIHAIRVPDGKLPHIKEKELASIRKIVNTLPDGLGEKLLKMVEEIPDTDRMVHGDCHTKNILMAGDEALLIDMDTLSVGHPIFELVHMYNAYVGYSEYDPEIVREFQGYSAEVAHEFWRRSLAAYLGTDDENVINSVEEKVRCVSYAKLLSWSERHSDPGNTKDVKTRALWRARLIELLGHVDSLLFDVECGEAADPSVLKVEAAVENLEKVLDFINAKLDAAGCSERAKMQIDLAAEEIFVNIASYAYAPGKGDATVRFELAENNSEATLSFTDGGRPFNPLAAAEPDVTLPVEEREVGGLGIFLTGKLMDDFFYEYRGGKNILTMKKKL